MAFGIFGSRLFGLLRESLTAYFFGVSPYADVWRAASRAPNALQNMLGEQTLSAAFIPIYSRMLAEGRRREAGAFAGAIFGLLLAAVVALVAAGWLAAPLLVSVLTPGFLDDAAKVAAGTETVDRFPLLVAAVRILLPMTGLLVLSAWALGVLNSHRRFLLAYAAPILWNVAIVGFLVGAAFLSGGLWDPAGAGAAQLERWLMALCWGGLAGGLLQFAVQLPAVGRLCPELRLSFSRKVEGVRDALQALGPALAGRGVVQLSLYLDIVLASLLAPGTPGATAQAGFLMSLPVSLFGMSVAAAELPELARHDQAAAGQAIAARIGRALRMTGFVVWPSLVALGFFGYLVVGLLYRHGSFGLDAHWLVTAILAGYVVGLLPSTFSRLLQNAFFALRDTKTPARIAVARLLVAGGAALFLGLRLDLATVADLPGGPVASLTLGGVGLALGSSIGAWLEALLLALALRRRLPELRWPMRRLGGMGLVALAAALPAGAIWYVLPPGLPLLLAAPAVLGVYGVAYLLLARAGGGEEIEAWLGHPRLVRLLGGRKR